MLLNQKDIAECLRCTARSIRNYVKDKEFPEKQTPSGPMYDVAEVIEWRVSQEIGTNYQAERTRLTKEQADQKAIENAKAIGELIPASEVVKTWTKMASTIRQKFLGLSRKIAPHLVGRPQVEIEAEIDAEVKSILSELAESNEEDFIGADPAARPDGERVG